MPSPKLFTSRKLLEFDASEIRPIEPSLEFSSKKDKSMDLGYTLSVKDDSPVSLSPTLANDLKSLGYSDERISNVLKAVKILGDSAGRQINPIVFARIKDRYRVKMNVMVALASLCTQHAADLRLTLPSLVRFYKKGGFEEANLDEIERFVKSVVSRGEIILGVPSAWAEYCRMHKIRNKAKTNWKKSKK